jgi:hypothetical protein
MESSAASHDKKRTTGDLIDELIFQRESLQFNQLALVVTSEESGRLTSSMFISADGEPEEMLEQLNEAVEAAARPIGFLAYIREDDDMRRGVLEKLPAAVQAAGKPTGFAVCLRQDDDSDVYGCIYTWPLLESADDPQVQDYPIEVAKDAALHVAADVAAWMEQLASCEVVN